MMLYMVDDPAQIRISEEEAYILRDDAEAAADFAREVMKEKDPTVRRLWERDYYKDIKERYGSGKVAGALLMKVWDWTKEQK